MKKKFETATVFKFCCFSPKMLPETLQASGSFLKFGKSWLYGVFSGFRGWLASLCSLLNHSFSSFFMPLYGLCHFLFGRGTDSIPHVRHVHILFLLWVENSHLHSKCLVFTVTLTEFLLLFLLWIEIIVPNMALFTHFIARITWVSAQHVQGCTPVMNAYPRRHCS